MAQPFDRLKAVTFRHDDSHRTASLLCEPLAVQLVAENDGWQIERILEHAANRQRAAKHLIGFVIVVTVEEYPTKVFARLGQPQDFAERYTFPDAVAKRAANVEAGHHLGESNGMLLSQLHQIGKLKCVARLFRHRVAQARFVFGVGDDFEAPRVRVSPTVLRVSSSSE